MSWSRKADDGKRESKKELNAIVKKAIATGVRKELNSIQAKRKTDDSSDEDGELYMLEAFDLKDFNYADMENLKIKTEDEVSVWDEGQDKKEQYLVQLKGLVRKWTTPKGNKELFALDSTKEEREMEEFINLNKKIQRFGFMY